MTPGRSFVRADCSGTQQVPPIIRVESISIRQASKKYELNCNARDDSEMRMTGAKAVELETHERWLITAPFGFPVVPEVNMT